MSKKLKIVLLIMIVVVVCAGYGVSSYISNLEYETYEGNNMCFKYDDTLEISSREQKIGKNITISSKENDIEITTFLFCLYYYLIFKSSFIIYSRWNK